MSENPSRTSNSAGRVLDSNHRAHFLLSGGQNIANRRRESFFLGARVGRVCKLFLRHERVLAPLSGYVNIMVIDLGDFETHNAPA